MKGLFCVKCVYMHAVVISLILTLH